MTWDFVVLWKQERGWELGDSGLGSEMTTLDQKDGRKIVQKGDEKR